MKTIIETVKNTGITANLRKDGIVYLYIEDYTHINKEILENLIKKLKKLKHDKIPLIVEGGEFITIGQDAKMFAKEFEEQAGISSRAVITKNLAHKILVNYYYKNQSFEKPFKEFDDIKEAEKWLKNIE